MGNIFRVTCILKRRVHNFLKQWLSLNYAIQIIQRGFFLSGTVKVINRVRVTKRAQHVRVFRAVLQLTDE